MGTGKTPHVEYLINLLRQEVRVATLSRGYKRETKGFLLATSHSSSKQIGDEPRIFKQKFPHIPVAVSESRALGIPNILMQHPETQVILMDDAFQHRSVKPGLNILLTQYNALFTDDFLLPTGSLREWRSAYKRADMIVVTKCPQDLSYEERERIRKKIKPQPGQDLVFSYYRYEIPYSFTNNTFNRALNEDLDVVVLCGIANPDQLEEFLEEKVGKLIMVEYADHYFFLQKDLDELKQTFEEMESRNKIILTTEKDATRLETFMDWFRSNELPLYCLPIRVEFFEKDRTIFNSRVREYLLKTMN